MNEERHDTSLFIGLHKLAAQNGDGLVPELYALLTARAETTPDMTNVVAFPGKPVSEAKGPLRGGTRGTILSFVRT
nr:hypothetical protein [Rhizobium terrae]